jgi:hypothetical protein
MGLEDYGYSGIWGTTAQSFSTVQMGLRPLNPSWSCQLGSVIHDKKDTKIAEKAC